MLFIGDDTWMNMFPCKNINNTPPTLYSPSSVFAACYPLDSFHTRDIHSVDGNISEILSHEFFSTPTTVTTPWDVVITHFLGN